MALTTAVITVAPHLLCEGSPAQVGDQVIIAIDQSQFDGAEDILATITEVEQVTTTVRGCESQLTCAQSLTVEFDNSMLPEGLSELLNCHISSIRCASCCAVWKRVDHIAIVLQPNVITETAYFTQMRLAEDYDLYGFAVAVAEWPSVYGIAGPHLDVSMKLQVSNVGGNAATTDVSGASITLLRATPETHKKNTFASPVRIDAGRQIYLTVTESGGTVPPEGLSLILYFRLASDS